MDPTATWNELLAAYAANDCEAFCALADDLRTWLNRGGFPPPIVGHPVLDRILALSLSDISPQTLFPKG